MNYTPTSPDHYSQISLLSKYQKAIKQISKLVSLNKSLKKQLMQIEQKYTTLQTNYKNLQQKYQLVQYQYNQLIQQQHDLNKFGRNAQSYQLPINQINKNLINNVNNQTINSPSNKLQNYNQGQITISNKNLQNTPITNHKTQHKIQQRQLKIKQKQQQTQTLTKQLQKHKQHNPYDNQPKLNQNHQSISKNLLKVDFQISQEFVPQNFKKKISNHEGIITLQNTSSNEERSVAGTNGTSTTITIPQLTHQNSEEVSQAHYQLPQQIQQKLNNLELQNKKIRQQYTQKKQRYKNQIKKLKQDLIDKQNYFQYITNFITKQQIFIEDFIIKQNNQIQQYHTNQHNKIILFPQSNNNNLLTTQPQNKIIKYQPIPNPQKYLPSQTSTLKKLQTSSTCPQDTQSINSILSQQQIIQSNSTHQIC